MSRELFCLHCEPPSPGHHEESCPLFKTEEEVIMGKYEDIVAQVGSLAGLDEETISKLMGADREELKDLLGEEFFEGLTNAG